MIFSTLAILLGSATLAQTSPNAAPTAGDTGAALQAPSTATTAAPSAPASPEPVAPKAASPTPPAAPVPAAPQAPAATAPSEPSEPSGPIRRGLYLGISLGLGSATANKDSGRTDGATGTGLMQPDFDVTGPRADGPFSKGRELAFSGNLRAGVALAPELLLGGNFSNWTAATVQPQNSSISYGVTETRLSAEASIFPMGRSESFANGLYLRGGAGVATLSSTVSDATRSEFISTSTRLHYGASLHAGLGVETKLARRFYVGAGVDWHTGYFSDTLRTNQVEGLLSLLWY